MQFTRRNFIKAAALTSTGYWTFAGNASKAQPLANDKLGIASFGSGYWCTWGIDSVLVTASKDNNAVLFCTPDKKNLEQVQTRYPQTKIFTDYRKAFDEMEKSIDVVTVRMTAHMHACISLRAMRAKKHCYTDLPIARTIYEARLMGQVAKEMGVVTQMGNMGSDSNKLRIGVAQIKAGVLGDIKEIHVWSGYPAWACGPNRRQTIERFSEETKAKQPDKADELIAAKKAELEQALETFDWDSWLGPAPVRPFWTQLYYPFSWHGWWDFGSNAIGQMGCHTANLPHAACDLKNPTSAAAKTSGHDFDSFPRSSEIKFEFSATDSRPAMEFYWYDGGEKPPQEVFAPYGIKAESSGALVIGEKGALYSPHDYNTSWSLRGKDGADAPREIPESELTYPRANGLHVNEFFRAIRENKPEMCWSNFPDNAAPFTETLQLGNVAVWAASEKDEWGERIEWDAKNCVVSNLAQLRTPGIAELVKPKYREGHKLD
jgi:predicted dehydrogenase